jgi:hypothetical protein
VMDDGRVDAAFANAPRDHLGVLGAEIENDNLLAHRERGEVIEERGRVWREKKIRGRHRRAHSHTAPAEAPRRGRAFGVRQPSSIPP